MHKHMYTHLMIISLLWTLLVSYQNRSDTPSNSSLHFWPLFLNRTMVWIKLIDLRWPTDAMSIVPSSNSPNYRVLNHNISKQATLPHFHFFTYLSFCKHTILTIAGERLRTWLTPCFTFLQRETISVRRKIWSV